jgi:hypothetical protein
MMNMYDRSTTLSSSETMSLTRLTQPLGHFRRSYSGTKHLSSSGHGRHLKVFNGSATAGRDKKHWIALQPWSRRR